MSKQGKMGENIKSRNKSFAIKWKAVAFILGISELALLSLYLKKM